MMLSPCRRTCLAELVIAELVISRVLAPQLQCDLAYSAPPEERQVRRWGGASPPAVQGTELDSRRPERSSRTQAGQRKSPPALPPAPPPRPLLPRRLLTRR